MVDPVLLVADGQSYEQQAIQQWLESNHISPVTGEALSSRDWVPNHSLRNLIQAVHDRGT